MHYIIYTKNNQEKVETQESYESALESYDSLIQDSNVFPLYHIREIDKIISGVKEDYGPTEEDECIIDDEHEDLITKYLKEMYELEHGLVE